MPVLRYLVIFSSSFANVIIRSLIPVLKYLVISAVPLQCDNPEPHTFTEVFGNFCSSFATVQIILRLISLQMTGMMILLILLVGLIYGIGM